MVDFNSIIHGYEGKGLPYRDRSDDIRIIVLNLCKYIYYGDTYVIKRLISSYKCYKFINDIRVDGRNCTIDYDEGVINFSVFPYSFFNNFCNDVFKFNDTYGECHNVTQKVLENCSSDYISAITSLCVNSNFILYFHSYICDRRENKIMDFSRKLIMDKNDYDKLFCYKQINDLNYFEYRDKLNNSLFDGSLFPLFYLALNELGNKDMDVSSKVNIKSL